MQALFVRGPTGLNIVPIKYSSDIHSPKHNYDIKNIADITVWHCNFYSVMVFENRQRFLLQKMPLMVLSWTSAVQTNSPLELTLLQNLQNVSDNIKSKLYVRCTGQNLPLPLRQNVTVIDLFTCTFEYHRFYH